MTHQIQWGNNSVAAAVTDGGLADDAKEVKAERPRG